MQFMMQGIRQTGEGGMEFKPQRSRKTGRAILIISSAFIVFNIWVFVFAGISAGLAMSGASILLLFLLYLKQEGSGGHTLWAKTV